MKEFRAKKIILDPGSLGQSTARAEASHPARAPVRDHDAGGADRLRQHHESAAGARGGPRGRDGGAARHRGVARATRCPAADRVACSSACSVAWRRWAWRCSPCAAMSAIMPQNASSTFTPHLDLAVIGFTAALAILTARGLRPLPGAARHAAGPDLLDPGAGGPALRRPGGHPLADGAGHRADRPGAGPPRLGGPLHAEPVQHHAPRPRREGGQRGHLRRVPRTQRLCTGALGPVLPPAGGRTCPDAGGGERGGRDGGAHCGQQLGQRRRRRGVPQGAGHRQQLPLQHGRPRLLRDGRDPGARRAGIHPERCPRRAEGGGREPGLCPEVQAGRQPGGPAHGPGQRQPRPRDRRASCRTPSTAT